MSGDRLAHIESDFTKLQRLIDAKPTSPTRVRWEANGALSRIKEERDALVEIAKAARVLLDEYEEEETEHGFPFKFALRDAHRSLRSALARLDRPSSGGTADSGAAEENT